MMKMPTDFKLIQLHFADIKTFLHVFMAEEAQAVYLTAVACHIRIYRVPIGLTSEIRRDAVNADLILPIVTHLEYVQLLVNIVENV